MSPQKKYQRTFAGKRVTSTGLAGTKWPVTVREPGASKIINM
jgi:hypothetical protein